MPGSNRMRSASVRAFDAYAMVQRRANRILEELDEVTATHGVPTTELHEEDSAVTTIEAAREVLTPHALKVG
jgi:uncharacterized SAM-binding protein YcdF (DUF218 family)